ncbi:MAG TPA: hypothetical protein VI322_03705 [Candidatus Saccharimonadia bacterium]
MSKRILAVLSIVAVTAIAVVATLAITGHHDSGGNALTTYQLLAKYVPVGRPAADDQDGPRTVTPFGVIYVGKKNGAEARFNELGTQVATSSNPLSDASLPWYFKPAFAYFATIRISRPAPGQCLGITIPPDGIDRYFSYFSGQQLDDGVMQWWFETCTA